MKEAIPLDDVVEGFHVCYFATGEVVEGLADLIEFVMGVLVDPVEAACDFDEAFEFFLDEVVDLLDMFHECFMSG